MIRFGCTARISTAIRARRESVHADRPGDPPSSLYCCPRTARSPGCQNTCRRRFRRGIVRCSMAVACLAWMWGGSTACSGVSRGSTFRQDRNECRPQRRITLRRLLPQGAHAPGHTPHNRLSFTRLAPAERIPVSARHTRCNAVRSTQSIDGDTLGSGCCLPPRVLRLACSLNRCSASFLVTVRAPAWKP